MITLKDMAQILEIPQIELKTVIAKNKELTPLIEVKNKVVEYIRQGTPINKVTPVVYIKNAKLFEQTYFEVLSKDKTKPVIKFEKHNPPYTGNNQAYREYLWQKYNIGG